ncbi:MAG: DUF2207 domain-containing protein [Lactobacillaceae bacterium]|nr:DUF2207 domain-containing protein [Lactobacillaceae bacterium]
MRKLFFTLCFISTFFFVTNSYSAVRSVTGLQEMQVNQARKQKEQGKRKVKEPEFETPDEYDSYVEKRIKRAVVTEIALDEAKEVSSTDVVASDEYIEMMKREEKGFFQQVYENALARVSGKPQTQSQNKLSTDSQPANVSVQQEQWIKPDYQTVNATLPGGTKVLVPAIEHIPYLMSEIEILPTGLTKVSEKIVVVANGEKLKNGLSKSLPRYSYSRAGDKYNLNVNLVSVKINGSEIEYKIDEVGNLLILSPKNDYVLEPGVYTYDFEYIVDRQVVDYDTFREFYWNITGKNWNLIVARVGAILRMPGNVPDLGRTAFINSTNGIDMSSARYIRDNENILGFISTRPVFVGESMDIIVSIDSKNFIPVDVNKKIDWIIDDYGDIILTILGLLAIVGAYFVSWIFISDNKTNSKYSIQRNGPILRYLTKNIFDKISFGSFILELYKRNIIDIKENSLIKLTDSLGSLSKNERLAVNNLFVNKESVIVFDRANALKINRAYALIEKDTKDRVRNFLLKINFGYIIFSAAMLLLSQVGIAMLAYSPPYNMAIMVFSDIAIALSIWLLTKRFSQRWIKYLYRTFAILLIIFAFAILLSVLNTLSALLIIAAIYAIFAFTNMFSNRNGLIKNTVKDAKTTKEYLMKNIDSVSFPRNFSSHQPNIFALEAAGVYNEKMKDKDFYKLDLVSGLIKKM